MDLEFLKIPLSATILDVANKIDKNHLRCVFVEDRGKIVGVCSQGDIVRMLLAGGNEFTPVEKILKPSFIYLHDKDWEKACKLIKQYGITVIPILDEDFGLKDVITLPMVFEKMQFVSGV